MTDIGSAHAGGSDADREDLELEEARRALVADGFEQPFPTTAEGAARCTTCGATLPLDGPAVLAAHAARDTPTDRRDLLVAGLRCPTCATAGHAVFERDRWQPAEDRAAAQDAARNTGASAPGRGEDGPRGGLSVHADVHKTPEHPLGTDAEHLVRVGDGDTRTLRERGPLLDEDGDDIREYTGEPVETDEGTVIPQQQNVGPGNEAGGGEWPDPRTPPSQ